MLSVWIVTLIAILHRSGLAIAPATANLPLAADGSLSTPSKTAFNKSVSNKPINKSQADNESEIADLLHLAETQIDAADYEKAIATYQNAIAQINQLSTDNIDLESIALTGIADAYAQQHNYAAALPFFEQALALFTEPDHTRQTNLAASDYAEALIWITTELGQIHEYLAHFGTALAYYQQLLTPETSELLEPYTKADLLLRKGIVETEIGQYTQAETTLKASIALIQSLEQSPNQTPEQTPNQSLDASLLLADAIAALAWTYEQQQNYSQAITQYQAALTLYQQINDPGGISLSLSNLGSVYLKQENTAAAQDILTQAQTLPNAADDPYQQAVLFDSFGLLYQKQGNPEQAWLSYRQALNLSQQSTDKISEIGALLNLGRLMESQSQPEVAIFFYKQAIARIEAIRQDLQALSTAIQKRYTLTVEEVYRHLADLLLQQDRTSEALEILELLKIQEVAAYFHNSQSAETTPANQAIAENALLSRTETALTNTLSTLPIETSLTEFLELPEVNALAQSEPGSSESPPTIALPSNDSVTIESIQTTLRTQPTHTAAIYPLILEDRLEIVLITAEGEPIHYPQPVTQAELSPIIHELQKQLRAHAITPTAEAQQLYSWLIRPLEADLAQQQIENIIYLPDGILRYIPIAALHDGGQWFTEKYQSHNITATSVDKLNRANQNNPSVLAGAFTDTLAPHNVQVGQQQYYYAGLPAARDEINNLQTVMPNTTALFDRDFSPQNTLGKVDNHHIVHLATHANFLPGQPESSFVLFGDGSTVNMRDIGQWQLPNVDLVVFSACQTALSVEGDGKELLGLGFQIQQTGAGAAIAALWAVDDDATAALMNQFYTALSQGQTKAQALRYAQEQLINSQSFKHPHYWAAFILIGNGL